MFDIFGINKLKMKKEELEQEVAQLREIVIKLNASNKQLTEENNMLKEEYKASFEQAKQIKAQLDEANMKLKSMLNVSSNSRFY